VDLADTMAISNQGQPMNALKNIAALILGVFLIVNNSNRNVRFRGFVIPAHTTFMVNQNLEGQFCYSVIYHGHRVPKMDLSLPAI
jgi:hypothetical protein